MTVTGNVCYLEDTIWADLKFFNWRFYWYYEIACHTRGQKYTIVAVAELFLVTDEIVDSDHPDWCLLFHLEIISKQ